MSSSHFTLLLIMVTSVLSHNVYLRSAQDSYLIQSIGYQPSTTVEPTLATKHDNPIIDDSSTSDKPSDQSNIEQPSTAPTNTTSTSTHHFTIQTTSFKERTQLPTSNSNNWIFGTILIVMVIGMFLNAILERNNNNKTRLTRPLIRYSYKNFDFIRS